MDIYVLSSDRVKIDGKEYRCVIGKTGFTAADAKREGDLKTPVGSYLLREVWYRPDKVARPHTQLPVRTIQKDDGWCDDPKHPHYNRHVKLPFEASHEKLWRDDDCYDLIVPIGYNDARPAPGHGSAIFLHIAKPGYTGTEGCVALAKDDLAGILPLLTPASQIHITS